MGFREKLGELFPKGFHPTDEEIIEDLQRQVLGQTGKCVIPHVDVHEQDEAWELASMINGRVPKGKRTNWVLYEYHLAPKYLAKHNKQDQMACVGCRLRKKKDKKGAVCGASQSDEADDHSISISNASDLTMESRVAEDDPMSMSDNPDNVVAEGSVIVVEDGSHSSCSIAPETEIADIPGNKEMQINNYPSLEEEPFQLDFNHFDNLSPSLFLPDTEMQHGSGSIGGGVGDWWIAIASLILEEPNDPEDEQGRGLFNDLILPKS